MTQFLLYVLLGTFLGVGVWQLIVWLGETMDKNRKYQAASTFAIEQGKPLLVVCGPWGSKPFRHWFNKPAHGFGDVCLDINRRAIRGHPCGVIANVTHMPFEDKCFGAAFASHLLEHLPTTADARGALDELHRVADTVHIVCPSRQSIAGWVIVDHHLWIWQKGNKTYIKQRGNSGSKESIVIETATGSN